MTEEELLKALLDASVTRHDNDERGMTSFEIAELWGISHKATMKRLRQLVKDKKIKPCKIWRENIQGVEQRVYGYAAA